MGLFIGEGLCQQTNYDSIYGTAEIDPHLYERVMENFAERTISNK